MNNNDEEFIFINLQKLCLKQELYGFREELFICLKATNSHSMYTVLRYRLRWTLHLSNHRLNSIF